MQITMLTASFHPRIGGVEKHILGLAGEFTRRGHDVTVLAPRNPPDLPREERHGGIRILRFPQSTIPHTQKPGVWLWMLRRYPMLADSDILHVHDPMPLLAWFLPSRILLPGKPVFVTFHGHEGIFPLRRRHRCERKLAERLTRGNICVGHYLEKWYGTRSDAVTYGAVKPPRNQPPHPKEPNIVYVGRLEEDTGILLYMEALRLLREKTGMAWNLRICGDGSLRDSVRDFALKHGLDVQFPGFVKDPMPHVHQSRFVFSSGYLAILEAMVCRRLVFSVYDNPLKRDYLEMLPNAKQMMVICGNAEELAEKFHHMIEDPAQETSRVETAFRFAQMQTWGVLADIYLKLYGRLH